MRLTYQINRLVLVVALMGCSVATAQEVLADFLLGTDFSKYHTYKWISIAAQHCVAAYSNLYCVSRLREGVSIRLA